MKNVVEVMGSRSTKYGGVEKFMVRFVEANLDLSFHIIYNEYPRNKDYVDDLQRGGVKIYVLNTLGKDLFTNLPAFYKLIRQIRPVIVHFHFSPAHSLWGIVCKVWGVPIVFRTAHCCVFDKGKNAEKLSDMSLQHRIMMMWGKIFKIFDKNLCVSNFVLTQHKRIYGDYSNNETIYLGTEEPPIISEKEIQNIRVEMGITEGTKVLFSVLFADRIKGCDVLLQSLPMVKGKWHLIVVGMDEDSNYTKQMHQLAIDTGIENQITWIGITNEVHKYFSIADLFIQPSRTEALSLAAVEAMSHGLPVIASNVGGLPEVASSLFESEDSEGLAKCITYLLNNTTEQKKQGAMQYERWKTAFCIDKGVKRYSELYHQ